MLIDPAIRDWVMIPLLVLVIISVYVRMHAVRLLAPSKPPDADEAAQRDVVARAGRLRAHAGYISFPGFAMRKDYLTAPETGKLVAKVKTKPANPMAQMDMMKQQVRRAGALGAPREEGKSLPAAPQPHAPPAAVAPVPPPPPPSARCSLW